MNTMRFAGQSHPVDEDGERQTVKPMATEVGRIAASGAPSRGPAGPPARGRTSAGSPHQAFTFIEVCMVAVILAIVALIALPRYASAENRRRSSVAAQRIAADLGMARARARSLSSSQTVSFSPASGQYQIVGMADPDRPARSYVVNLGAAPYAASLVSVDLGGDATIIFDGYGSPDSGGTIVVRVGSSSKTIVVDPITGVAAVQ